MSSVEVEWRHVARDAPVAARYNHALAVVEQTEGAPKVYAVGGQSDSPLPPDAFVEIFHREGDGWTVGSSPPAATAGKTRVGHATAVIGDTVFLIGGLKDNLPQHDILEFHSASDTWKTFDAAGAALPPRAFHSATAVNGRIYVVGGKVDGVTTTDVYVFDPKTRAWSKPSVSGPSPPARHAHSAVLLPSSMLAVFGGRVKAAAAAAENGAEAATAELWLLKIDDSSPDAISVSWGRAETGRPAVPVVICGPSGVGKGTLIARLMDEFPTRCGFSVSHTTRQPRPGEQDGVHYHFAQREDMEKEIAEGRFLEKADVHGNLYGTSVEAVKRVTESGKLCILDIDVQGAQQVKSSPQMDALFVFVAPPSIDELEKRLRGRGTETEDQVQKRLGNARAEMDKGRDASLFHHTIVNDSLEEAYAKLKALLGMGPAAEAANGGAPWPYPRSHAAAAAVGSHIIIHGGQADKGAPLDDLHILDLSAISGGPPSVANGVRCVHTHSIPTPPSPSLITTILATVGLADAPPAVAAQLSARFGHQAAAVGPGEVVFVGGSAGKKDGSGGALAVGLGETVLLLLKGL